MSTSTYLFVEGIPGDSSGHQRDGWIDVLSLSWGVHHEEGATHAQFGELAFTKLVDSASPELALACAESRLIPAITIDIVSRGGDSDSGRPLSKLKLHNCRVESLTPAVSDGGDFVEQISLSYEELEWSYTRTRSDGSLDKPIARSYALQGIRPRSEANADQHPQGARGPRASSLHTVAYVPSTAFIVMWMDPEHPELEDVHLTIKDVCRSFGIAAVRADDIQHDDRITDVILERIRSSEFVFADLTGERPNVYYEVGHAHAMGKRPILFRRRGSALHFDLSVHNVREYKNVTELRELLIKRLEALTK